MSDKDKGGRPPAKPALMAQAGAANSDTAIVPYRNRAFLGMVTDEEGYQQPRRPMPRGVTFGDFPVTHREASQRLRKAGKFAPLIDDDDDYDMEFPQLDSAISASSTVELNSSENKADPVELNSSENKADPMSSSTAPPLKPVSRKKIDKRKDHDFRKAIEESDKINRAESARSSKDATVTSSSISMSPSPPHGSDCPAQYEGSTGEVIRQPTQVTANNPSPVTFQPLGLAS